MATNQTEYMRELMRHRRALKRGETYDPETYSRRGSGGPRYHSWSPPTDNQPIKFWRGLIWHAQNPNPNQMAALLEQGAVCEIHLRPGHCHRCGHVTDQPICWICKLEVEA